MVRSFCHHVFGYLTHYLFHTWVALEGMEADCIFIFYFLNFALIYPTAWRCFSCLPTAEVNLVPVPL